MRHKRYIIPHKSEGAIVKERCDFYDHHSSLLWTMVASTIDTDRNIMVSRWPNIVNLSIT